MWETFRIVVTRGSLFWWCIGSKGDSMYCRVRGDYGSGIILVKWVDFVVSPIIKEEKKLLGKHNIFNGHLMFIFYHLLETLQRCGFGSEKTTMPQ